MSRWLRILFCGLAAVLLAGAIIAGYELHTSGLPPLRAKIFWVLVAGAAVFLLAGWKLSLPAKFKIFLLLLTLGFVEVLLQAAAWLGVLPGVNTKERLPWGRVYWTSEGLGNSIRNRYGWYFPQFDLQKTNRLAVVGDSFVEAVEVHRTRNLSAVLSERLRGRASAPSVLALGNHGTGPAHYLEVLQYAHQHFAINDAIIVVYLGNDITDSSAKLKAASPEQFIFYTLTPGGALELEPPGERARAAYVRTLETVHRPAWMFLPRLAVSHCMSAQLPLSVRATRARQKLGASDRTEAAGPDAQLAQLGLKAAPFALEPSLEAREGLTILKLLLERAATFAAEKGIRLRLVVVPFFPPDFYAQAGTEWSARLGQHDFLAPERALTEWAAQRQIPLVPLGERMRAQRLTPEKIRMLYLSHGSGHFSEAGHRFAAEAMDGAFFAGER